MTEAKPPPSPAERSAKALERLAAAGERIAATLERLAPLPPPIVDLDHPKHGNPNAPFDPRSWKGATFKGRPFSQCPADYLEELAKALEMMGASETDEAKRHWKAIDAARARGWAERIRSGWKPRDVSSAAPTAKAPPLGARPGGAAPAPLAPGPPSYVAPAPGSLAGNDDLPDLDG